MGDVETSLHAFNRDAVLRVVRSRPGVTRTELTAITGLSRSTVAKIIRDLIANGVVAEEPRLDSAGRGRPATALRLTPRAGLVGGLDFGHSHVRAAVATAGEHVLCERTVALPTDDSPAVALRRGADLLEELAHEAGATVRDLLAVGVGLPAPIDSRVGRVSANGVLPGWVDVQPAAALQEMIGVAVHVDNDANLGARAEHRAGGQPSANLIYVKAASGIGAGLILRGEVYQATRGVAGELGHVRVPGAGELCRCGSRGCLETIASAPRILDELRFLHPDLDTFADLVALVRGDDPAATRAVADAGRLIGRVLADLCNVLAPDCVILGGQLSETGPVLLDAVRREIDHHAQPAVTRDLDIRISSLQDRAEITGAVLLAVDSIDSTAR
jgi:predicted NBD/HSP70 family sugar kinase